MNRFFILIVITLFFIGCKKNTEKVLGAWELSQYIEYDSLGDRKFSYSYGQECPFKIFELESNTWTKYDADCEGAKQNETDGIYSVDKDTIIVEGFDNNLAWKSDWYVINKLSGKKFEYTHIKSKEEGGDWEWVDNRFYAYRR